MRIWPYIFIFTLSGGCVSVPEPLRGEFPALTPQASVNQGINNQRVRWGGEIVNVKPQQDETCFEVLGQNLNDQARPIENLNSQGRFIACAPGFYDPAHYAKGRELTVVGTLGTTVTQKIGEFDYRYPRVSVQQVYLWPRQAYAGYPYYDDPYYGHPFYGSPFYGSPYSSRFSLGFFGYNNFYPRHYRDPYYFRDRRIDKPRSPGSFTPPRQNFQSPSEPSVSHFRGNTQMQIPATPRMNFQRFTPSGGPAAGSKGSGSLRFR